MTVQNLSPQSLWDKCPLKAWGWKERLGAALFLLSPLGLTFCCQLITLQGLRITLAWCAGHIPAVLLTAFLLLLAESALLLAFGRPFWAVLATALPVTVLSTASLLKERVNGVPLLISDLSMAREAGAIAGFLRPGMDLGRGTLRAYFLELVLLIALVVLFRGKALPRDRRRFLGLGGVSLLLAGLLLVSPLRALASGGEETQAERNDRLGLPLGLYSAWVDSTMARPADYTRDNLERILREVEGWEEPSTAGVVRPNVVLVVSESFFDVTCLPEVAFDQDPIPNFRALAAEYPSGTFLSNTYSGGTGNVEMELFTGIPSAFLGAGESPTTLADPTAYGRIPSLVRAFSQQGYGTVMVHSYDDSLYDRSRNLPQIGFDCLVYEKDFPPDAPREAGYLSDEALVDEMIRRFESKGEDPIFLYGLSMENHQPYHKDKFDTTSGIGITSPLLDQEGLDTMDALLHGLRDADRSLKQLTDYFSACDEPVLLVFLGDHLPGLHMSGENNLYTMLGYSSSNDTSKWGAAELKQMHSTDFLVWNNYGAELSVPETVSCTSLGAQLLSWAGVERPLYFRWVARATEEVLLYRSRLLVTGDGQACDGPTPETEALVARWKNLVYDILYGRGYIAEQMTW